LPAVQRGRARAGKSLEGFEIVVAVPVALTANVQAATALFKEEMVRNLLLPFYRAMLTAGGFGDALAAFDRAGTTASSPAEAVPDELVETLGGIGDEATVRAYASAYREAGVTLPAIRPIGFPAAPHYRATLQAFAV
jgi:hypothetical protein